MRNCFQEGNDKGNMKQVDPDRWFNPAFQKFPNTQNKPSRCTVFIQNSLLVDSFQLEEILKPK